MLRKDYGEAAAEPFGKSRLRDRLDAIIAHKYEECRHGGRHVEVPEHARATDLPISDWAREICVAMQRGWRGQ